MNNLIRTELLKIASHISYDWFNNGFCNFFESESYGEDLENLRDYAGHYNIRNEVIFLKEIHEDATEKLRISKYRYDDDEIDYIYNGNYIEDEFGKEKLEAMIESLLAKLGYVQQEEEAEEFNPFTDN